MEEFSLGKTLSPPRWECLLKEHPFSNESLAETLLGGQAFRWFHWPEQTAWVGSYGSAVTALRINSHNELEAAHLSPQSTPDSTLEYLAVARHQCWLESVPLKSDPVVANLFARWAGLVVLRQPFHETLLAYICSANKQIPHIRGILEALADTFGNPIQGTPFRALPTWHQLAQVDETDLRQCGLGYRAPYVAQTSRLITSQPDTLQQLQALPTSDARNTLMQFPGVGPKVADCVLLFGLGRADAFPVDTWIDRILRARYPSLAKWTRAQLCTFAGIHFGPAAGLVQQWFFADARANRAQL